MTNQKGHFFTKSIRLGFTLVEMLIVVLVIAILVVIGTTQYQRFVVKSRYSALMPITKTINASNEVYYLTHGSYAQAVSNLDTSAQANYPDGTSLQLRNDDKYNYVLAKRDGVNNTYIMYQSRSSQFPSAVHCEAKKGDEIAQWLCETALKGTKISKGSITSGYDAYALQGDVNSGSYVVNYSGDSGVTLNEGDTCTASGAQECQNIDAHGAECTASGNGGCSHSSFSEDSTCNSEAQGGCFKSTFTDSSCVATVGGSNSSTTSCGGASVSDSESHYIRSSCTNDSNNGYACGRSLYEDRSECTSNKFGGCGKSTFNNYSVCYGNSNSACDESTFTDHSYCVASVKDACKKPKSYDATSYCMGDYCPAGTPKNPEEGGGTWRKCDSAHNDPQDKINAQKSC